MTDPAMLTYLTNVFALPRDFDGPNAELHSMLYTAVRSLLDVAPCLARLTETVSELTRKVKLLEEDE